MIRLRFALLGLACLLGSCDVIDPDQSNVTPTAEAPAAEDLTPIPSPTLPTQVAMATPKPAVIPAPDEADVISSLTDLVIALDSTESTAPLEDLRPLKEMVGDAEIVGLGESTHGTREFMTIRYRMVRLLVEKMGFTHIAIEAPWAGIEIANRYVQGEMDDVPAAQDGLSYFSIQNSEFWDLLQWLREHNLRVEPAERVQIVGIDPQSGTAEASRIVLDFVLSVDPGAYDEFAGFYPQIDQNASTSEFLPRSRKAFETLSDRRGEYVTGSSQGEFAHALQAARVIYQGHQVLSQNPTEGYRLREQFMADNLDWVRQNAGPDARIVVWGHNAHVSKENPYTLGDVRSLGGLLDDRHGERYFAFGFDFAAGSFIARPINDMSGPLTTFTIDSSREDTFAHLLQTLDPPTFMINLRDLDPATSAGRWLTTRRAMFSVGCCYTPLSDSLIFTVLTESFDAMVFVEHATAATLLDSEAP